MEKSPDNIYKSDEIIKEEKDRLKNIEWPSFVSLEVVGENVSGRTILDLGAGPNITMNDFAKEHGASYVAFDMVHDFSKEQKNNEADAVRGAVEGLPFKNGSADIVHTRFVLMHLSPEARERAIKEAIRTSKGKCIFIEYDWGTFHGGENINHFRDLAISFLQQKGIDPFMGAILKNEIENSLSGQEAEVKENRFHRENGDYYRELMPLIQSIKKAAEQTGDVELVKKFSILENKINNDSQESSPGGFIPPDLVVVEVELNH